MFILFFIFFPFKGYKPAMVKSATNFQIKSFQEPDLRLVLSNWGYFGNAGEYSQYMWSCEFPKYSGQEYLFQGALWIGAKVGSDYHTSVGTDGWQAENEMFPGSDSADTIIKRSINPSSPYYDPNAISEEDIITEYTDTVGPPYSPDTHFPLGLQIKQNGYAWWYPGGSIILEYWIKNIGTYNLDSIYVGLYIDGDCHPVTSDWAEAWYGAQDDATGFRRWADESDTLWPAGTVLYHYSGGGYLSQDVGGTPKYQDPKSYINTAWLADADGFNDGNSGGSSDNPSVTGASVLYPRDKKILYNWWFSDSDSSLDWGPGGLLGDPNGGTPSSPLVDNPDTAKYWILSDTTAAGGVDPDQVGPNGVNAKWPGGWPPAIDSINDTRYLLSFGGFSLAPGDSFRFALEYAGGENFHYSYVIGQYDFSSLADNIWKGYQVYDNPGVDTDGDGNKGDFVVSSTGDTVFITGDGVPDYMVPPEFPPAAPRYLNATRTDTSVYLKWEQDEMDIKGFNVYRADTTGGPYTKLNTTLLPEKSYLDTTNLVIGNTYYYVITAVDTLNQESGYSDEISVPFGKPYPVPSISATWGKNAYIDITLQPSPSADVVSYNIWRRSEQESTFTLTGSISNTSLRDTSLINGVHYYYYAVAVDTSGLESDASDTACGLPMGFDSGILLVDETPNLSDAPDSVADSFYHTILSEYTYTDWDNSDGSNPPSLQDLSPYILLIWHHDYPLSYFSNFSQMESILEDYLKAGGRLWVVGSNDLGFSNDSLTRKYLHIKDIHSQSNLDFIGATGDFGYPSIMVDSTWLYSHWGDTLRYITVFTSVDGKPAYYYISGTGDTTFDGKVCASQYIDSTGGVIIFGFLLSYMERDAAISAGKIAVNRLMTLNGIKERKNRDKQITKKFLIYPNPSSYFHINAVIPVKGYASIKVYDITGRIVKTLIEGNVEKKRISIRWDGKMDDGKISPAGIYFIRINAPSMKSTKKVVLLR